MVPRSSAIALRREIVNKDTNIPQGKEDSISKHNTETPQRIQIRVPIPRFGKVLLEALGEVILDTQLDTLGDVGQDIRELESVLVEQARTKQASYILDASSCSMI